MVENRKRTLSECADDRVNSINKEVIQITAKAFLINSGGWLYIAVPFLILLFIGFAIFNSINRLKRLIKDEAQKLAYASETLFSQFTSTI